MFTLAVSPLWVALALCASGTAQADENIVYGTLKCSLEEGSLAGTTFQVRFSYDANQVAETGDSWVSLHSLDFTLLGVPFTRSGITEGGQVIFRDGVFKNLTASFQGEMPPGSPVVNVTFGFGGDGVIGYIDRDGQFGRGSFVIEDIVFGILEACLFEGSLAGATFPVLFSYDARLVAKTGDSFVPLDSFDFILLGVAFTRDDIFQGGQVIFRDGVLRNVTASFQVILPDDSPVENITFGFGGDGVIGYIDLGGEFGSGFFVLVEESGSCHSNRHHRRRGARLRCPDPGAGAAQGIDALEK